jgi:hypothetical protein
MIEVISTKKNNSYYEGVSPVWLQNGKGSKNRANLLAASEQQRAGYCTYGAYRSYNTPS